MPTPVRIPLSFPSRPVLAPLLAPRRLDEQFPIVWNEHLLPNLPITQYHLHDCLEIGYCHEGSGIFLIEDKGYRFQTGDVVVINEREAHRAGSTPGTRCLWSFILLDPSGVVTDPIVNRALLRSDPLAGPGFPNLLASKAHPEINSIVRCLVTEFATPGAGHRELVRGLVLALMVRLHRLPGRTTAGRRRQVALERLAPAIAHIEEHHREDLRIPALATLCRMSPTSFRRHFTAATGHAPKDYLLRVRVNRAKDLLLGGERSILDIAFASGFESLSAFNRQFKRQTSQSPRDWRKRGRGQTVVARAV